jgi:hypothetical protein
LPAEEATITLITMQSSLSRRVPAGSDGSSRGHFSRRSLAFAAAAISFITSASSVRAQLPQAPASPSGPSPYTGPGPAPLETGGLRPPSSTPAPASAGESETLLQLERAEREDAGRGLEFLWVDVEGGYEYLALQAFHSSHLLDGSAVADSDSGFALGLGAGVRLIFLTLGGRFRLARFSAWDLYTLDAELGLHLPVGDLEPSFTLAAGYAKLGSPSAEGVAEFDADRVDISGFNARLGANLDYYVNPLLSFGARSSFELLALWRGGAAQPASIPAATAATYARDGDGIGFGVTLSATVGLHF